MSNKLYDDPMLWWAGRTDHSGSMDHPDRQAIQTNPLCGDRVTIQLEMKGDAIRKIYYQVRGCILCRASCAYMASLAQDLNESRVQMLRDGFENFLKLLPEQAETHSVYEVFSPVRPHRSRHRCVLLPYETTLKAISDTDT